LVVVRRIVSEFDTEVSSTGKPDQEHRLLNPGMLDGSNRPTSEHGLKAPGQLLTPMRAGGQRYARCCESDHNLAALSICGP
jgi:hypothetical protein